ncbi:MAG TPA: nuclear transport factor 2 family protein, partial [Gemmatimonadota bacterium]|nr:nuclear transport factor 2 family protein [Gemmatimonadota bacterium]
MPTRLLVAFAATALAALPLPAQDAPPNVVVPTVETRAEDVETIDGIVAAFYEVISGPAGQPRDWGRDATLYLE